MNNPKLEEIILLVANILEKNKKEVAPNHFLIGDLGLDSLDRAELVGLIRMKFGKQLKEKDIDSHTKVEHIPDLIVQAGEASLTKKIPDYFWPLKSQARLVRRFFVHPIIDFILFFFLNVKVTGEFPDSKNQYFIIVNHRSNLDGYVSFRYLPLMFRRKTIGVASDLHWRSGAGYRHRIRGLIQLLVPFFTIDNEDVELSFSKTGFYINKGLNIIIFPEGAIKHNKKDYNDFKKGAAKMIREFKLPVILMKIDGLNVVKPHQILPRIGRHKIQIDIEQKTINPYNSIADITKELKEAFKGY